MTGAETGNVDVKIDTTGDGDASSNKGRIVVGVDGSTGSMAGLGWAIDEAREKGAPLHVVMTWRLTQTYGSPIMWGAGMVPLPVTEDVLAQAADDASARLMHEVIPDDVPTTTIR